MKYLFLIITVVFSTLLVHAQVASPIPGAVDAVNGVASKIPASLPLWIITLVVSLSEVVARRFPTVNPMSWFLVISALFKGISSIFEKISNLLDSIIGQNTQPPSAPPKV